MFLSASAGCESTVAKSVVQYWKRKKYAIPETSLAFLGFLWNGVIYSTATLNSSLGKANIGKYKLVSSLYSTILNTVK